MPLWPALAGALAAFLFKTFWIIDSPIITAALIALTVPLVWLCYQQKNYRLNQATAAFFCFLATTITLQSPSFFLHAAKNNISHEKIALSGTLKDSKKSGKQTILEIENIQVMHNGKTIDYYWFNNAKIICFLTKKIPIGSKITLQKASFSLPKKELEIIQYKNHLFGFFFAKEEDLKIDVISADTTSWINTIKSRINDAQKNNLSKATQSMVGSIFLGQSEFLTTNTRSLFEVWGISHYLARSGLHLILMASLLIWLLQLCNFPLNFIRFFTLVLTILYHLISTPSISFFRALSMNLLIAGAFFLGETAAILHLFSFVTLATILSNPFVVYGLDFQLSFGISGALIFIFNIIRKIQI